MIFYKGTTASIVYARLRTAQANQDVMLFASLRTLFISHPTGFCRFKFLLVGLKKLKPQSFFNPNKIETPFVTPWIFYSSFPTLVFVMPFADLL